ncbi:CHAT domain-containing protein [Geodermatophilus maliterrae]|uniref:CHAT domain-containing protein n=1 Tax=Geodermatophilus maliterrae TaxID=3162531 RepID=A0ABV3XDJ0_9ACTN
MGVPLRQRHPAVPRAVGVDARRPVPGATGADPAAGGPTSPADPGDGRQPLRLRAAGRAGGVGQGARGPRRPPAGRPRATRPGPLGDAGDLRRQLRRGEYHVFHFIGHGRYDPGPQDGVLALEGPGGRAQLVTGADTGALLHDHRSLRLALLNSCEGARGGLSDPYSGTAQSLVYQGIPAVVAMQFEITDHAAITFGHSLYEAVADGYPLDAAMAEARNAVRDRANPVEWATPVLYLRAADGRVFDVRSARSAPGRPPDEATPDEATSGGGAPGRDHARPDGSGPGPAGRLHRWGGVAGTARGRTR